MNFYAAFLLIATAAVMAAPATWCDAEPREDGTGPWCYRSGD